MPEYPLYLMESKGLKHPFSMSNKFALRQKMGDRN